MNVSGMCIERPEYTLVAEMTSETSVDTKTERRKQPASHSRSLSVAVDIHIIVIF
jgi:hypothetical protein